MTDVLNLGDRRVERHGMREERPATSSTPRSRPRPCSPQSGWRRALRGGLLALLLPLAAAGAAHADEPSDAAGIQSLDEQVQAIKSDVLAIAAELDNLEERLLYPSETQVAIFVAVDGEDEIALDSARVSIDGELVTHHVYSFKEVEALGKGGVQRIYTGNVRTGSHRIEIELRGQRGGGKDFEVVEGATFDKQKTPKRVGITVLPRLAESPRVSIEDW